MQTFQPSPQCNKRDASLWESVFVLHFSHSLTRSQPVYVCVCVGVQVFVGVSVCACICRCVCLCGSLVRVLLQAHCFVINDWRQRRAQTQNDSLSFCPSNITEWPPALFSPTIMLYIISPSLPPSPPLRATTNTAACLCHCFVIFKNEFTFFMRCLQSWASPPPPPTIPLFFPLPGFLLRSSPLPPLTT